MNFIKQAAYTLAAIVTVTLLSAFTAEAQYRLPESHSSQHRNLLANQRPMGEKFKIDANNALYKSLRDREQANDELMQDEIYANYWESQMVNPYANATIPAVQHIDVSGYYPPVPGIVTSNYGYRPRFGRVHRGIDLRVAIGDTVASAFDGVVRLTKFERKGYGYYVVIRHDNGMETVYGHLSKFLVKPNQRVRAGQPIALGGNTGRSTGPHLHFETRFMGLAINPAEIIDFERRTIIADTYVFNKATFDKSQNFPKSTKKKTTASRSKKKSKKKKSSRR